MKTFYNNDEFQFAKVFADNWEIIRNEYKKVSEHMVAWPEKHLHNNNWEVFGLFGFPDGAAIENNCELCPETARLIKENIKNNGAAGFSRLQKNSIIKPHRGYYGEFLRMHIGLIVPDGDVGIKVGDDTYHWKNGEVVVFDDRITHEAWNKTNEDRIVLIVDFIP
jgi:beta-hydroxylase